MASSSGCIGPITLQRISHAQYGEAWAQVAIETLEILEGELPPRALRLIREWAQEHRPELLADWERAQRREELAPIAPLA